MKVPINIYIYFVFPKNTQITFNDYFKLSTSNLAILGRILLSCFYISIFFFRCLFHLELSLFSLCTRKKEKEQKKNTETFCIIISLMNTMQV